MNFTFFSILLMFKLATISWEFFLIAATHSSLSSSQQLARSIFGCLKTLVEGFFFILLEKLRYFLQNKKKKDIGGFTLVERFQRRWE